MQDYITALKNILMQAKSEGRAREVASQLSWEIEVFPRDMPGPGPSIDTVEGREFFAAKMASEMPSERISDRFSLFAEFIHLYAWQPGGYEVVALLRELSKTPELKDSPEFRQRVITAAGKIRSLCRAQWDEKAARSHWLVVAGRDVLNEWTSGNVSTFRPPLQAVQSIMAEAWVLPSKWRCASEKEIEQKTQEGQELFWKDMPRNQPDTFPPCIQDS